MFSDAISSISCRCRPSSPLIALAISGSASARVAVKKESGAEAVPALVLALEELIGEISPPPQPVRQPRAVLVWRSKEAPAPYHIAREWPSDCGSRLIFMQDMVGMTGFEPSPRADTALHLTWSPGSAASPKQHKNPAILPGGALPIQVSPDREATIRSARPTNT